MTKQSLMKLAAVVVATIVGSTSLTGAAFAHGGGGGGGMGGAAMSVGGGHGGGFGGGFGGGGRDGGGFGGFDGGRMAGGGHLWTAPIGAMSPPHSYGGDGYGFGHPTSGGFYNRFDGSHQIDRFIPYALGAYGYAPFGIYGSAACTQLRTYRTASGGWVTRPTYVCG